MTLGGASRSTRGSFAVREKSASAATIGPGARATPKSLFGLTMRSKFVAVPKSTVSKTWASYVRAATELTRRSAPTSLGLSVSTVSKPERARLETNILSIPQYCLSAVESSRSTGGATDEMTACSGGGQLSSSSKFLSRTAYWSAMRIRLVGTRQCATRSSPSKRPKTVLVLPVSTARSMRLSITKEGGIHGISKSSECE